MEDQEEIARGQSASEDTARSPDPAASPETPNSPWDRIKRHKVVEWSLAYIAFGYAALHSSQMLRETLEWPYTVPRFTLFALMLGFPIAVTLAWYHGHRAQHRVSRPELSILISLLVVAGTILWWVARSSHERVETRSLFGGRPRLARGGSGTSPALELAPNDAVAKFFLGNQLASFGEIESAISLTRQALATEPLVSVWSSHLAV